MPWREAMKVEDMEELVVGGIAKHDMDSSPTIVAMQIAPLVSLEGSQVPGSTPGSQRIPTSSST